MALARKAGHLLALQPDIAVVLECSDSVSLDGMVRIEWSGRYPRKGMAVFARPELTATVAEAPEEARRWCLPIRFDGLDLDLVAVWGFKADGNAGVPREVAHRAVESLAPILGRRRAIVIGDFNDGPVFDARNHGSFARTTELLGAAGYTSLYHAWTLEPYGAETAASLFYRWHRDEPFLIDHAFVPTSWLPFVSGFSIGSLQPWLEHSDHMPLVVELTLSSGSATPVGLEPAGRPRYSQRFVDALAVAARLHAMQVRKSTDIPYVAHLPGTCAIALEYGATEDEAIAALLHDAIEDVVPTMSARAAVRTFGDEVTRIVEACTDADTHPKPPWRVRKEAYVAHLATTDRSVLLVSASDKLHNARAIVGDLRRYGSAVWERFNGGHDGSLWYYRALANAFRRNPAHPVDLVDELDRVVTEMESLARDA
jgi:GTP pyrophosphokinase